MHPLIVCTNGKRHNFIDGRCFVCDKSIIDHKADCLRVNRARANKAKKAGDVLIMRKDAPNGKLTGKDNVKVKCPVSGQKLTNILSVV